LFNLTAFSKNSDQSVTRALPFAAAPLTLAGLAVLTSGLPFLESGLSFLESGLSFLESGLSFLESGLPFLESDLPFLESGLSVRESGLSVRETGLSVLFSVFNSGLSSDLRQTHVSFSSSEAKRKRHTGHLRVKQHGDVIIDARQDAVWR